MPALPASRLEELDAFLIELNRAAGEAIAPLFRGAHGLTDKIGKAGIRGFDPVTEAERSDDADHAFEVEVTREDGTDVDVELDAAFAVLSTRE